MILCFKCSNFGSVLNEEELSMVASADNTAKETLIGFGKSNFLRVAVIYGANGSGKSTILNSIAVMCQHVISSFKRELSDRLSFFPHLLNENNPTEFNMIFEKGGIEYSYFFSYNERGYLREELCYRPAGKTARIFSREGSKVFFGPMFKASSKSNCKEFLKDNRLLLSVAANITSIKCVSDAFLFFKEDILCFSFSFDSQALEKKHAKQLLSDTNHKERIIKMMNSLGSDIVDIRVEERPNFKASDGLGEIPVTYDVEIVYPRFTIPYKYESTGTKRMLKFLGPFLDALDNGKTVICDELEANFHPSIVRELVINFNKNTSSQSQLICSTHDTALLDLDILRRDQIYFTELRSGDKSDRSTDLYSLAEIRNIRTTDNIRNGYLSGKYGAIPAIGMSEELFSEEEDDY